MLILAPSTIAEVGAQRCDPFGRLLENSQQLAAAVPFLHLRQLDLDFFPRRDKRNKDHEITNPAHSFPTKGRIRNRDDRFLADFRRSGLGLGESRRETGFVLVHSA